MRRADSDIWSLSAAMSESALRMAR